MQLTERKVRAFVFRGYGNRARAAWLSGGGDEEEAAGYEAGRGAAREEEDKAGRRPYSVTGHRFEALFAPGPGALRASTADAGYSKGRVLGRRLGERCEPRLLQSRTRSMARELLMTPGARLGGRRPAPRRGPQLGPLDAAREPFSHTHNRALGFVHRNDSAVRLEARLARLDKLADQTYATSKPIVPRPAGRHVKQRVLRWVCGEDEAGWAKPDRQAHRHGRARALATQSGRAGAVLEASRR